MADLGIFTDDKFSLQTLTAAINEQTPTPTRIAELGLFAEEGVPTTTVTVEKREQLLQLVANKLRTEEGAASTGVTRAVLNFNASHLPVKETITADEIQNVRAFGTVSELETIYGKVQQKLSVARSRLDATIEYHRLGAIKGQILDADGTSELYNLYTIFGIAQPTKDVALATATTDIRKEIVAIKRTMEAGLMGANYRGVRAFCGSDFMDALCGHKATVDAYNRWQDGAMARKDYRNDFGFAGAVFEEYNLSVGGVNFIAPDEAYIFPEGVFGMFKTTFSPANYVDTANTIGLPYYAKQWLTDNSGKSVTLEAQSNPVCINLRPKACIKLKAV